MAACEMCGKTASLVTVDVERVGLSVCRNCATHGTVKQQLPSRQHHPFTPFTPREEPALRVISGYAQLLRSARAKKEMDQKQFSRLLQEKESLVAKWEAGNAVPPLDAARRIGNILNLTLVEEDADAAPKIEPAKKTEEPTLGDFVKVRKRR